MLVEAVFENFQDLTRGKPGICPRFFTAVSWLKAPDRRRISEVQCYFIASDLDFCWGSVNDLVKNIPQGDRLGLATTAANGLAGIKKAPANQGRSLPGDMRIVS